MSEGARVGAGQAYQSLLMLIGVYRSIGGLEA